MAELSKQALKVQNNTEFPNNNAGLITPSKLRGFNTDMIDSLVDEISYNADSASWNSSINSLNAFTASQNTATASLLVTASAAQNVITFTKGDGSQFNVTVADTTDLSSLNQATASLQAFTQSANVSINALNQSSASQQVSINALNSFSASQTIVDSAFSTSITNINSATASLFTSASLSLTTASFNNGNRNLTFSKGDGTTFSVNIPDQSGSAGDFVTTASFNAYTSSNDQKVNSLISATGSYATTGSNTFVGIQNFTNQITASNTIINGDLTVNPNTSTKLNGNTDVSGFLYVGGGLTLNTPANITWLGSGSIGAGFSASVASQFAAITPTATGSLLTTASVSLNTITFTKGDSSTFQLTVDTGSGQSIPAGTISGSAQITALGFVSSSVTASSLVTASISGQLLTFTKGNGNTFNLTLPTGSGGGQAVTASYGAFSDTTTQSGSANVAYPFKFDTIDVVDGVTLSGSTGLQVNSTGVYNIQFSAQGVQGAGAGVGNIWFRQNGSDIPNSDTQFTIPSNQKFVAAWNIFATASAGDHFEIIWRSDSANTTWAFITGSGTSPNSPSVIATVNRIDVGGTTSIDTGSLVTTASFNAYTQSNDQKVNSLIAATGSYATTGSNTFQGAQTISGSVFVQNDINAAGYISASVLQGPLATLDNLTTLVGANLNGTTNAVSGGIVTITGQVSDGKVFMLGHSGSLVLSNSTATPTYAGLSHLSSSQLNANTNLIFKTNTNTGTTQISGSANIFVNPATPTAGYVRYIGGTNNLFLNGQGGNLPQITGSAASVSGNRPTMNSNFIAGPQVWTINQSVNPGTHIYSHNIINGTSTMNFNMLGNTGAVTFGQNILSSPNFTINSPSQSVANVLVGITGSNALTITSNLNLASQLTYNGPISSSNHQISQNLLPGFLTMNVQSGSRAYTISSNVVQGFTINDNTVSAPNLGSTHTIGSNNIGNVTINNRASASINIQQNQLQGFTISNDYDSSTNGSVGKAFVLQGNNILGFIGNNIYFSGSANGTGTANDRGRGLYGNVIGGSRISASVIGDGNKHLLASAIIGQGLNIYGTSLYDASNALLAGGANGGSAFFGRWNAEDGNRANSSETVFVVGTGVSGSAGIVRKTGFLIDSGSNTFVEGSLNVSGSASFTGSVAGNVVSASITSNTASIDFSLGNYFELTSSVTPLHLNVTNITPGRTSTLIISASASSSILFSPNVAQPSGNAYSGSAGSIDILSFVSFNASKVNLVATKNLI